MLIFYMLGKTKWIEKHSKHNRLFKQIFFYSTISQDICTLLAQYFLLYFVQLDTTVCTCNCHESWTKCLPAMDYFSTLRGGDVKTVLVTLSFTNCSNGPLCVPLDGEQPQPFFMW